MKTVFISGGYTVVVVEPASFSDFRERFQRLRYEEFSERRGWEVLNPERLEQDDYDPHAPYVYVRRGKNVLAACRLIDSEGIGITLPSVLVVPGRSFEISRVLSLGDNGREQEAAMLVLYQGIASYAFRERGYDHLYCDTRYEFYRKLRLILRELQITLGEPVVHLKNGVELKLVPTRFNHFSCDAIIERLQRLLERFVSPVAVALAA